MLRSFFLSPSFSRQGFSVALELGDPPASAFIVLGLKACTTIAWPF